MQLWFFCGSFFLFFSSFYCFAPFYYTTQCYLLLAVHHKHLAELETSSSHAHIARLFEALTKPRKDAGGEVTPNHFGYLTPPLGTPRRQRV